jgi:hypothetical protein
MIAPGSIRRNTGHCCSSGETIFPSRTASATRCEHRRGPSGEHRRVVRTYRGEVAGSYDCLGITSTVNAQSFTSED